MKRIALIIILVGILLLPFKASAFVLILENPTDNVKHYWLYWIDHDWAKYGVIGPANIAGGELRAHNTRVLNMPGYPDGLFFIIWRDYPGYQEKILVMKLYQFNQDPGPLEDIRRVGLE